MKKSSLVKITSIFLCISSISLIVYASYKIYSAKSTYKQSLNTWNYNKTHVVDVQNNSQESAKIKSGNNTQIKIIKQSIFNKDIKNGEIMGKILIKNTKEEIPIIQGTDEKDLLKGSGHYLSSSLPGIEGNCIIFGHRDGVFSGLKKVALSDMIVIETYTGTFSYTIYETKIVKPDDKYISEKDKKSTLTLVTCYPFSYIGDAPERFVVKAELVH
ncbi:class D sortase [Clostridium lacusfryxellense]|uniref:class D sortase n=1 Tax=Clostridium lacusfryxellense TaxID=205328 RepID=UPI001C0AD81D|nr:class D sortase [Clostridium lacusfryxellense]MBU3110164.1 class D sortase [Clostridium lacusfryxellense]